MKEAKRTVNLSGQKFKTKTFSVTKYRRDREKELQVENRGGGGGALPLRWTICFHSLCIFTEASLWCSHSVRIRYKQCACQ